jgi:hypothetical protein
MLSKAKQFSLVFNRYIILLLIKYNKSVMAYCRPVDTERASFPVLTRLDMGPKQRFIVTATKPRIIFAQFYSKGA